MEEADIKDLFGQFEGIVCEYGGAGRWSARETCMMLGYTPWRNFDAIIENAKRFCNKAGVNIAGHFADVGKMVAPGYGSEEKKFAANKKVEANEQTQSIQ